MANRADEPADTESSASEELAACRARLEQLEQADYRKNVFLGKLAHEIGNLTLPVQLAVEVISHPDIDQKSLDRVREILSLQMPQIQAWIDVLRCVSRLSRILEVRPVTIEVATAVSRAVQAIVQGFEPASADRRDDVQAELPTERLAVRTDPDYLQTILVELLSNAVRYSTPGDAVRITADRIGDTVQVTVADEGPGIAPEFLPQVFDPLVRGDGQWDWEGGHIGVRLALARRLAETMRGSITADSEGPGRGSRFVLTLPAADPAEPAGERGASAS